MWPIAQTAAAAGLAWYITRDVLDHPYPFFAPIAAAVCLWMTSAVRAEIAVEMMVGVALGIALGAVVREVLATGAIAIAAAVLLSLCVAMLIGQGFVPQRPMFVNQTTMSAILLLTFPLSGLALERIFDALIGGGLALVFSLVLFPKNPVHMLRDARNAVLEAVADMLARIAIPNADSASTPDGTVGIAGQLHRRLAELLEVRKAARLLVRVAPRRWRLRYAVRTADRHAARSAELANAALLLVGTVTRARSGGERLDASIRAALGELSTAVAALAVDDPATAAARAVSIRHRIATPEPAPCSTTQIIVAGAIDACVGELLEVADFAPA
ncbi:aromatic acid exporter family protein [Mycobacterium spongiae]|uniref:Aromatic acid exporter family protein n=1 Tax=Mycobacterium spongiae TaxID=886343 RepID=A0A975K4A2_9MYCO|nr:aromatic acid exporter family protein [Mycobacterium spongiae]